MEILGKLQDIILYAHSTSICMELVLRRENCINVLCNMHRWKGSGQWSKQILPDSVVKHHMCLQLKLWYWPSLICSQDLPFMNQRVQKSLGFWTRRQVVAGNVLIQKNRIMSVNQTSKYNYFLISVKRCPCPDFLELNFRSEKKKWHNCAFREAEKALLFFSPRKMKSPDLWEVSLLCCSWGTVIWWY